MTTPAFRRSFASLSRLGAVLLIVGLTIALGQQSLEAQTQVYLKDAVQAGQVEALITGKSIRFTEPMLNLKLHNRSANLITVVVHAGLELTSEDPSYADVVVGKAGTASLQAGEERSIDLYTFSLDPTRSFPPPETRYSIRGTSDNTELLILLDRVQEQRAEGDLAAQLAVWMQATGSTFDQLEEALGVSLGSYRAETLDLLGLSPSQPDVTTWPGSVSGGVTSTAFPQATPSVPSPISTIGLVGIVALLAMMLVLAYIVSPHRRRGSAGKQGVRPPMQQEAKDPREESRRGARLLALDGEQVRHLYDLPGEGDILLSRVQLPFIVIPLKAISAPHALLFRNGGSFQIKDLNSSNGTFIDGQRLPVSRDVALKDREASLHPGTQVTFGNLTFTFEENPPLLRNRQGKTYALPAGDRVIITRLRLPYLEISDNAVSAPHALLGREGNQYVVKDLNSGNGTQLGTPAAVGFNYETISEPAPLKEGLRLRLGRVELEMQPVLHSESDIEYIGPFRVIRTIGIGGMARVLESRDPKGRRVAVKVPLKEIAYEPEFRERFDLEATTWQQLCHQNIVAVIEVGEDKSRQRLVRDKGLQYIAMNYVNGCSLADLLSVTPHLDELVMLEIVRCVASALRFAHEQDVVHRDIKPNNILISSEGEVFITDFGIAKAKGGLLKTPKHVRLGVPHYMSPEQAAGREIDGRSDIYSLGVVIYKMLTGHVPYGEKDPLVLMDLVQDGRIESPPHPGKVKAQVSSLLAEVAMRCLKKDPGERYQNAQEIIERLHVHKKPATAELAALVAEVEKRTTSIDR